MKIKSRQHTWIGINKKYEINIKQRENNRLVEV